MTKCSHPKINLIEREKINRFSHDVHHVRATSVSAQAFKPNNKGKFSVFRTTKISLDELWKLCETFVDGKRADKKIAMGRIENIAGDYIKQGLTYILNGEPHTRHLDITGWNVEKMQDQEKRTALAIDAKGYLRPN